MTLGDALFTRITIRDFDRLSARIGDIQSRIAAGTNDPRISADPARATQLSALRDLRARMEGQTDLAARAGDRLALVDRTLQAVSAGVMRMQQIAQQAANDTLTPEAQAALRIEATALRDEMQGHANATDSEGRALFGGTAAGAAFSGSGETLAYRGNGARPLVRLGDGQEVATGLAGPAVFGTAGAGLFGLANDLVAALTPPMLTARAMASAEGSARLDLLRGRPADSLTLTLTGPAGSAEVVLDLRADAPGAAAEAINAVAARTGIAATMAEDGSGLLLSAAGRIALSDLALTLAPPATGSDRDRPRATLTAFGGDGGTATVTGLRPARLAATELVGDAAAALDRVTQTLAEVGALGATVDRRTDMIAARRLELDLSMSRLGDLDVAEAATRLQSLLLSQEAAQQTFVRIAGSSLFDYL
ncbi:flagellin N-terminal helical domain-containing protein [Frigidibacter oleivorans]|uniref:flagellin N-terminal helical domain-containing protein n=1 Tax=Frigidibacter oleivorans TaxID=2487129 RepID=UPI000F8CCD53|nr:flagellin hook IN motif-containing protein [Frigidibacter oleivorans]